jgi:hypothetical protein
MNKKTTQWFALGLGVVILLGAGVCLPRARAADPQTVKGEVVDLMCYLDHGAKGEKHAGCAKKCIEAGGPVGLLTADDQLYLLIGDHKPINEQAAAVAGKTVTVKGKVVERNGVKMIADAQITP